MSLIDSLTPYKRNPSMLQRAVLDHLYAISKGEVEVTDYSNPFSFLLESASAIASLGIVENGINTRKTHAVLAQTELDLYVHMSDKDFVDRFAQPGTATFKVMMPYDMLLNAMVDSPSEYSRKVKLPRNTELTVNDTVFSLQYPIEICEYYNGLIQVKYVVDADSPYQVLTTNIIKHEVQRDPSGNKILSFSIPVLQVAVSSSHFVTHESMLFQQTFPYNDSFYSVRVFQQMGSRWEEMRITHSAQVFDPFTATASIHVNENTISVSIPPIYIQSGKVTGNIRIDTYTTKGAIGYDLSQYPVSAFGYYLKAIDDINDTDDYTAAMSDVSMLAFSTDAITGGRPALTFSELRDRVINNSTGPRQLPVTNVQLAGEVSDLGYTLIRNQDTVTNRVFLATKDLPSPNLNDLVTPANVTFSPLVTTFGNLVKDPWVINNGQRITLPSNTLFRLNNGVLSLVPSEEKQQLLAKPSVRRVEIVNKDTFLYTPFHYVMDASGIEFSVRGYYLDNPESSGLSFETANASTGLQVSTAAHLLEKTATGFKLTVVTTSNSFYQDTPDGYLQASIAFLPSDGSVLCHIPGKLLGTNNKERIFQFDIVTNHDILDDNTIKVQNCITQTGDPVDVYMALSNRFSIFYSTSSRVAGFKPSAIDVKLNRNLFPRALGITEESILLTLGSTLKHLWSNANSVLSSSDYLVYQEDVYKQYSENQYAVDPITGTSLTINDDCTINYLKTASKGDYVLDINGDMILLHPKGSLIYENGSPKPIGDALIQRQIDLLLVDGEYYFATEALYADYRNTIAKTIAGWITEELTAFSPKLLEQTRIYYYAKKALGSVSVLTADETYTTIESRQTMNVFIYLPKTVYEDALVRQKMVNTCVAILDKHIKKPVVSISDIVSEMKTTFGKNAVSIKVDGLGGKNNYETVSLAQAENRLSLGKQVIAQPDGDIVVTEAVNVEFIKYTA